MEQAERGHFLIKDTIFAFAEFLKKHLVANLKGTWVRGWGKIDPSSKGMGCYIG